MESLISRCGGHLRYVSRPSSLARYAAQPAHCNYATFPVCLACRGKVWKTGTSKKSLRRWASQVTAASSSASKNLPPKQSISLRTHYDLFPQTLSAGPPPAGPFVIDTRQLRKEFLQLQAVAHPDRHPQELKQRAEATSARVNEAYKTLQNPLLRAQYLLSLRGIDVAKDETAKVEDPELLMEVLETREEIEAAEEEEELRELKNVNSERIEASEKVLEEAFRRDDLMKATDEAVRLRYWINIKDSLDAWEKGKPVVLVH